MSTTAEIKIAPLPTTEEVALTLLQWLFSTIGVPTDYNIGSIIRTYSEAIGSTEEIEGITAQAQATQALVYSAYAAFGISPLLATASVGTVVFSTLSLVPLPAGQSVQIPLNSIVQTTNGIQFATTSNVILTSGTSSVSAPIQSVQLGANNNVVANTINQIASGLAYPLSVTNPLPTAGGQDAETASQTLTRFLAFVDALGLCSPIAVASAARTVTFGQEKVQYSSCIEPWITQVELGDITPTAGFVVAIDNGSGSASANLISAVTTYLSSGAPAGYRPAGVPFDVIAVNPVLCSVVVVGTAINPALATAIQTAINQAILTYFSTLNFGDTAESTQLIAAIANVSFGQLTSLSVTLLDNSSTPQTVITASGANAERIVLQGFSVTIN
jgi:uncharacterized phage protein gp47/JayE